MEPSLRLFTEDRLVMDIEDFLESLAYRYLARIYGPLKVGTRHRVGFLSVTAVEGASVIEPSFFNIPSGVPLFGIYPASWEDEVRSFNTVPSKLLPEKGYQVVEGLPEIIIPNDMVWKDESPEWERFDRSRYSMKFKFGEIQDTLNLVREFERVFTPVIGRLRFDSPHIHEYKDGSHIDYHQDGDGIFISLVAWATSANRSVVCGRRTPRDLDRMCHSVVYDSNIAEENTRPQEIEDSISIPVRPGAGIIINNMNPVFFHGVPLVREGISHSIIFHGRLATGDIR